MLFYRAAVDLSRPALNYVAGIVRRHRRAIRSRWWRLHPGQQALLVLVHLRKGETFAEAAAGFGVFGGLRLPKTTSAQVEGVEGCSGVALDQLRIKRR